MEIRVWRSYSCNNSSSYRLVARFGDPIAATDAAAELTTFFTEHAKQMDVLMEDGDVPDDPPEAAVALAAKYGFEWKELFTWGDEMLEGDEPKVTADNGVLVVYHTYCGGYPEEVNTYLTARGATTIEKQERSAPSVSVVFRLPEGSPVGDELGAVFAHVREDDDDYVEKLTTPWSRREHYGDAAFFSDGKTLGFYAPFEPEELATMKAWLTERGVSDPSIRLCEYGDKKKFDAIFRASCASCHGKLEYLDPRVHGIDKEHLSCGACGGMFDLDTFLAPPG